jgi:hypothetical protein
VAKVFSAGFSRSFPKDPLGPMGAPPTPEWAGVLPARVVISTICEELRNRLATSSMRVRQAGRVMRGVRSEGLSSLRIRHGREVMTKEGMQAAGVESAKVLLKPGFVSRCRFSRNGSASAQRRPK